MHEVTVILARWSNIDNGLEEEVVVVVQAPSSGACGALHCTAGTRIRHRIHWLDSSHKYLYFVVLSVQ